MRILIVEDNHVNQVVLVSMLKKLDAYTNKVQIHTADHGASALTLLEELQVSDQAIDVIFMDCQMPIMNGFEATKKIRNSKALYANISIIAVTGNVTSDDEKKCFECGMNAFMNKPFKLETIRELLHSLNISF